MCPNVLLSVRMSAYGLKVPVDGGGVVENIYINNINMIDIPNDALIADLYYAAKSAPSEPVPSVSEETPAFRNIYISDVFCRGAGRAAYLNGLPEMPIENISIKNMVVTGASYFRYFVPTTTL